MEKVLLVFLGGGFGSLARYGVGLLTTKLFGTVWPYGTFTVNVVGGFAMGLLIGFLAHRGGVDQDRWRLLVAVGVLGGFTTFSSFSLDVVYMIQRRELGPAAIYILLSVVLSVTALFFGLLATRRIFM
jgi:CrcB protein